jgi:hypothetical protein
MRDATLAEPDLGQPFLRSRGPAQTIPRVRPLPSQPEGQRRIYLPRLLHWTRFLDQSPWQPAHFAEVFTWVPLPTPWFVTRSR